MLAAIIVLWMTGAAHAQDSGTRGDEPEPTAQSAAAPDARLRRARTMIAAGWVTTGAAPVVAFSGYALALSGLGRRDGGATRANAGTAIVVLGGASLATGLVLLPLGYVERGKARRDAEVALGVRPDGVTVTVRF